MFFAPALRTNSVKSVYNLLIPPYSLVSNCEKAIDINVRFIFILCRSQDKLLVNEIRFSNSLRIQIKTKKITIPGGILDISLGGEVRPGPSYPDPV